MAAHKIALTIRLLTGCCNPMHLEPVTPRENLMRSPIARAAVNARKTDCGEGHAFTPENTYVEPKGGRVCKTCRRAYQKEHRLAR